VEIPKKTGGVRELGIPTVSDGIAQTVVAMILEPILDPHFHEDSYGYRPGRSAIDAVGVTRRRCWRYDWVLDLDVRSFFDRIDHGLLMRALRHHTQCPWVLLYVERWLEAPIQRPDGSLEGRDRGTPQGGVISPLLANIYLHWLDKLFHREAGPRHWANARLVRYADDFVVLARYQGERISHWLDETLEDWLGLTINREKTKVVDLRQGEALDFLGFTFRFDRDLYGSDKNYLNVTPSKKSLQRAREAIRAKTGPKKCYKPAPAVVQDLNEFLRGWSQYFEFGYPRKAFRDLGHYARCRMVRHLNRRSQRKYHRPPGKSHYQYLKELGLCRL